jgi:putative two-component system response regulator
MIDRLPLNSQRILVVDDDATNIALLKKMLGQAGYQNVLTASSGCLALEMAADGVDLIILDLHMPQMDGYEVLLRLREAKEVFGFLPILVFTADATLSARQKALDLGASDFLTKPGDAMEILLRVRNFLTMRAWHVELYERNLDLEAKVRERTAELERSQVEIVERLAVAGEYRDEETGEHTKRVGEMSGRVAERLGCSESFVALIRLAARLHDIGKVAVPDGILLKPGKLTAEEYEEVKGHCAVGAKILAEGGTSLLQMAERIAASHHERFDGTGYPRGLAGEEIPIEARIVAVADVFDALTSERPYKGAWRVEAALAEIREQRGRQFDGRVVDAFLDVVGG